MPPPEEEPEPGRAPAAGARLPAPALCAACGAALSYYALFPLFRGGGIGLSALLALLFAPVAAMSFFRALASLPRAWACAAAPAGPAPLCAAHIGAAQPGAGLPGAPPLGGSGAARADDAGPPAPARGARPACPAGRGPPAAAACAAGGCGAYGAMRAARMLPLLFAAFASGLALGIGSGARVSAGQAFGIPSGAVAGISGVLLDDPRMVSGGSAMATVSLRGAVAGSGGSGLGGAGGAAAGGGAGEMSGFAGAGLAGAGLAGARAASSGEIAVFFRGESAGRLREFGRGAQVFAEGRLQRPAFGPFAGAYVFSADSLHVAAPASRLDRFRTRARLALADRFAGQPGGAGGGEGEAPGAAWRGLALALLLGVRDSLDSGMAALYRSAGISYILALSGMHLAVIAALVSFLLKKPLGLRPAAIAGAAIIAAYCFLVGPLPSLYRSALMYMLGVLAVLGMLRRDSLSVLSMAFLIQLALSPGAGASLSFSLSYLAMLGILVLGKSLRGILGGALPPALLNPLALSLGAFIGTAGMVAWVFGDLRPAGILAGIAVAPLTTAFMIGSIAWLALDAALPALSPLLAWPLSLLYRLMEETARLASLLPGISASPRLVIALSLLASALLLWLDSRMRARRSRLRPFA